MKKAILGILMLLVCGVAQAVPIVLYDNTGIELGTATNPVKVSFSGTQSITGDLSVSGTMTVGGTMTASGDVEVDGSLYVDGTLYSAKIQSGSGTPDNNSIYGALTVVSTPDATGTHAGDDIFGSLYIEDTLEVDGLIYADGAIYLADGTVLDGAEDLGKWDDATGGINYSGGFVGVNQTSPSTLIDVADSHTKSVPASGLPSAANAELAIRNTNSSGTYSAIYMQTRGSSYGAGYIGLDWDTTYKADWFFYLRDGSGSGKEVMRMTTAGNMTVYGTVKASGGLLTPSGTVGLSGTCSSVTYEGGIPYACND